MWTRRILSIPLATALLLGGATAPAHASHRLTSLTTTNGSFDDPDDAATTLDIKRVTHTADADTITYSLETFEPFNDSAATAISWLIETDGDEQPDFDVTVSFNKSTNALEAVVENDAGATTGTAELTRPTSPSNRLSVKFPWSAIGNPPSYLYLVVTISDANGDNAPSDDEVDTLGPVAHGTPVLRFSGADRIETAVNISASGFDDTGAEAVVLARSDTFPDALAGTPLAVAKTGPLLLTSPQSLDPRVRTEIRRILTTGKTVYLLGGVAALSESIADALRNDGYNVVRFAGANRYETAIQIADQGLAAPGVLFLTTGQNFPDALAAGAAGSARTAAVLLTAGSTMPPAVAAYISSHPSAQRFAVGGPAAQADPAAEAVVGADRYETSRKVAERFFSRPGLVGIASGGNFPDALAGGVDIGSAGAPLLLSAPGALPDTIRDYLVTNKASVRVAAVYGGATALAEAVRQAVAAALNS
jgi:hypothetical protein